MPRRGPNGHYFKFVEAPGVTWKQALDAAAQETWQGYVGHLVTVTSSEEEAFIVDLIRGREIWLAGSDAEQEGTWRWMAGPEAGDIFYAEGAPVGFSAFVQGQPDGVAGGRPGELHRAAAFEACRWLIDTLKRTVPIWKKEHFEDRAVWADGEPFPDNIPRANSLGSGSPHRGPASK